MDKTQKTEIINRYARQEGDTGSPEVQVAVLTKKIQDLTDHLRRNPKDFSTQRGLLAMVSRRRSLLSYLSRINHERYLSLTSELGIRRAK